MREIAPIRTLHPNETGYPTLLKEIPGAPETLFAMGNFDFSVTPLVAIVGTRKATEEGISLARKTAASLASRGIGVASGLAYGIDRAAHEGALSANGKTVAVLANGLDDVYPKEHRDLALRMLEHGGAILSEYPAGTPPAPYRFLERNRIVSGISVATIVIEAPERSGALRTARDAGEQGRDVLVFPGPAEHPNYRGSHSLIRKGARLVSSFEDIAEDLSEIFGVPQNGLVGETESETAAVLSAIQNAGGSASMEEIAEATGRGTEAVSGALAMLSLEGIVQERDGRFCINNRLML